MAKLEYFIVSVSISVDQESNMVSLFNVLEEVRSKEFPAIIPQVVATSAWNRESTDEDVDYQVLLRIHAPGEESSREFPANIKIEKNHHRVFHRLINLQIPQPGELEFEVLINGQHAASHIVTILQSK